MLWGIAGFLITIGLLVSIHEWGHFWVARRFNVKIIRFSLGFGKPLLTRRGKKDGTLYTLALIPLGGFVQMLGEEPDEQVPEADKLRTFQAQKPWKRFLIAFAGPAVNLIFAALAFSALYLYGVQGLRPEVVFVQPDSIAARAGLKSGDIIQTIDGKTVKLSADAHVALIGAPRTDAVAITVLNNGQSEKLFLDLKTLRAGDEMAMDKATGIYLADEWLPAKIQDVLPDTSAAAMGLKPGDDIVSLDGQSVDIIRLSQALRNRPGEMIHLEIRRNGKILTVSGKLGQRVFDGKAYGFLGVQWVNPNLKAYQTVERYSIGDAFIHGWDKMFSYIRLTYDMFGKMITGKVSLDNMGGPITIGDAAGKTLRYGTDVFLNFLGIISLSLAAINLLPIPMLDGGHMLFYGLEMIRGKPLSERTMKWSFRIGAAFVYTLMGFVVLKDIWKYLL